MRPVAGVGQVGFTGTVRGGGPGRPEEECGQCLAVFFGRYCTVLHGVLLTQCGQCGVTAIQSFVVAGRFANRLCALLGDGQHLAGLFVAVVAHFLFQGGVNTGPVCGSKRVVPR